MLDTVCSGILKSQMVMGGNSQTARPKDLATTGFAGRFFMLCSWWSTDPLSTGPQRKNRWRSHPHRWIPVRSGSTELSNAVLSPPAALLSAAPRLAIRRNGCDRSFLLHTSQEGKRRSELCLNKLKEL